MATTLLPLLLLASLTSAQTTSTATILLPNVCTLQAEPSVTIVAQNNDLTTYTYNCSNYVQPTRDFTPFTSKPSTTTTTSPIPTSNTTDSLSLYTLSESSSVFRISNAPTITNRHRIPTATGVAYIVDDRCDRIATEGCIPWEITQGASFWGVYATVFVNLDAYVTLEARQECTFGDGGIASGSATCEVRELRTNATDFWYATGSRITLAKSMVDRYFVRNTVAVAVAVTAPGPGKLRVWGWVGLSLLTCDSENGSVGYGPCELGAWGA